MNQSSNQSQTSYAPTEYADNDWEIVGPISDTETFVPLAVEVLKGEEKVLDPMFRDYGGISSSQSGKRWHLPEDLAYKTEEAAREQAAKVVQETQTLTLDQIEAMRAEAFKAGSESGRTQALQEAEAQHTLVSQKMSTLFQDLTKQTQDLIAVTEVQAAMFAIDIARKIIDDAVEINPEYIQKIVHEAIELSGSATIKKVRISPADMEFVEYINLKQKAKEFNGAWEFEADETIKAGCIVETSAGEIDFQIDKAWERVRDNVVKVIRK